MPEAVPTFKLRTDPYCVMDTIWSHIDKTSGLIPDPSSPNIINEFSGHSKCSIGWHLSMLLSRPTKTYSSFSFTSCADIKITFPVLHQDCELVAARAQVLLYLIDCWAFIFVLNIVAPGTPSIQFHLKSGVGIQVSGSIVTLPFWYASINFEAAFLVLKLVR